MTLTVKSKRAPERRRRRQVSTSGIISELGSPRRRRPSISRREISHLPNDLRYIHLKYEVLLNIRGLEGGIGVTGIISLFNFRLSESISEQLRCHKHIELIESAGRVTDIRRLHGRAPRDYDRSRAVLLYDTLHRWSHNTIRLEHRDVLSDNMRPIRACFVSPNVYV